VRLPVITEASLAVVPLALSLPTAGQFLRWKLVKQLLTLQPTVTGLIGTLNRTSKDQ